MNLKNFEKMLDEAQVDLSLYGKGQAKTLDAFYKEISDTRESTMLLQQGDGQLLRVVSPFNVHIMFQCGSELLKLREVLQLFNDGRRRSRLNRQAAISEKMHTDETPIAAVVRAVKEEIGLDVLDYESIILLGQDTITKESQSYPGITSEYRIRFALYMMGEENFSPEGYVEVQEDKKTFFAWERA